MIKNSIGLVCWLLITFSAAWIGSRYMPGEWYAAIMKPSWNPPNWIFGPVWTLLYILMGISAWLVWKKAGFAGAGPALGLFIGQLALNALWSYLFFGMHRIDLALMEIVVLWLAILAIMVLFWRVHVTAGALFIPYLAWVSFASFLNFTLWRLNIGQ